jgi:hypothetical protein
MLPADQSQCRGPGDAQPVPPGSLEVRWHPRNLCAWRVLLSPVLRDHRVGSFEATTPRLSVAVVWPKKSPP